MNELDKKIREALREEDAEIFDDFGGEPSMLEMVFEIYRGRHRWLVAMTTFWAIVFLALAVVSGIKFFTTDESRDMLLWAIGFMFCMSAVSMTKVWFWMELNKHAITREIKRLELQIARLAARIKD